MKIEIGAGQRPTPGYVHNDVNKFEDIELVGQAWEIDVPENSVEEIIAMGVVEHLTYQKLDQTFRNFVRILQPKGQFLFDVPDLFVWSEYLYNVLRGRPCPFTLEHVLATFYGWQRWEGDEHKSGWTKDTIYDKLSECGFAEVRDGDQVFRSRPELWRRRLDRPEDAHIRIVAVK